MKVIRNGIIADGTGGELYAADLLIANGRIAALLSPGAEVPPETEVIDAAGMTVAPGFIDAHSHFEASILENPRCLTLLAQGCSTVVCGNCGGSRFNIPGAAPGVEWENTPEYIAAFQKVRPAVNAVLLSGHNSLRKKVMGTANRAPSAAEMEQMKALLAEDLALGCAGLTFGLTYIPGKYAETAELQALASVLEGSGKVIAAHIRDEGDELEAALEEMFLVAATAGVPFHVSHIKTIHQRNFHKLPRLLELIGNAQKNGQRITADRYPYIRSSTALRQILPPPYDLIDDVKGFLAGAPERFAEVAGALKHSPRDLSSSLLLFGEYLGRTIGEVAAERGISVETAATEQLCVDPGGPVAYLCMSESNMHELISRDWVCAGSDGLRMALDIPGTLSHPRAVGSLPRFFRLAADRLGVAEAVRKCTGFTADIFGIPERGKIIAGYAADLLIFDADKLDSRADYTGNDLYAEGISQLLIAGETAYDSRCREQGFPRNGAFLPVRNR